MTMQTNAQLHPRHAAWPTRLALHLQARQFAPFVWGSNDCCSFAIDGVVAVTGHDYMAPLRGQYSTAAQAARLMRDAGGLQALVCQHLGATRPQAAQAQRGDVVLLPTPHGPALGLCVGAQAIAAGELGTVAYSMTAALAAWAV
jgi:hypothetical protein